MTIRIYNEVSWLCPLSTRELKALLYVMHPYAQEENTLVLHVVHDGAMARYNKEHMQCAGPTNILSFPAEGSSIKAREIMHGSQEKQPDILVLSVHTLQRECLLYGQEILEHTVRLLAHGLGHVLGYDHGDEMYALCTEMEEQGLYFLQRQGLYTG